MLRLGSVIGQPGRQLWVLASERTCGLAQTENPGLSVLQDAAAAVSHLPGLQAVLVNCCSPQAVAAAIPRLTRCAPVGVRVGGYANGFKTTTSQWLASSGEGCESGGFVLPPAEEYDGEGMILPEAYARHVATWRDFGASIVGGCCGVGPQHIACIKQALNPNM
jgi:S-methylmethionine-dependent homocysteine/selenocysteine methylase